VVDRCRLHGSLEQWGMVEPRQSEAPTPLPAVERRTVWQRHRALVNREARGALAELLGALGVIVTLVYLAVPIRQNAASNRKGALQNVTPQDADFLAVVSGNSALADIFLRVACASRRRLPRSGFASRFSWSGRAVPTRPVYSSTSTERFRMRSGKPWRFRPDGHRPGRPPASPVE
jgi:hypothetical protein